MQRTWTILHQNEDFIYSSGCPIPGRIDQVDNIRVAFQNTLWAIRDTPPQSTLATYHDVHFLLNPCEHRLIWDCDTL
jgi:hypothetical protein